MSAELQGDSQREALPPCPALTRENFVLFIIDCAGEDGKAATITSAGIDTVFSEILDPMFEEQMTPARFELFYEELKVQWDKYMVEIYGKDQLPPVSLEMINDWVASRAPTTMPDPTVSYSDPEPKVIINDPDPTRADSDPAPPPQSGMPPALTSDPALSPTPSDLQATPDITQSTPSDPPGAPDPTIALPTVHRVRLVTIATVGAVVAILAAASPKIFTTRAAPTSATASASAAPKPSAKPAPAPTATASAAPKPSAEPAPAPTATVSAAPKPSAEPAPAPTATASAAPSPVITFVPPTPPATKEVTNTQSILLCRNNGGIFESCKWAGPPPAANCSDETSPLRGSKVTITCGEVRYVSEQKKSDYRYGSDVEVSLKRE